MWASSDSGLGVDTQLSRIYCKCDKVREEIPSGFLISSVDWFAVLTVQEKSEMGSFTLTIPT